MIKLSLRRRRQIVGRPLASLALGLCLAGCGAAEKAPQGVDARPSPPPSSATSPSLSPTASHAGHDTSPTLVTSGTPKAEATGHEHHRASQPSAAPAPATDVAQSEPHPTTTAGPRAATSTSAPDEPVPSATSAPPPPTKDGAQPLGAGITWVSGSGETGTDEVELEPGLLIVHIEHEIDTPFAVYLMNMAGDHLALLANHTTAFSGMRAYGITEAGRYYLHVIAHDGWRVGLEQPGGALAHLPEALSGDGPIVSAPKALGAGTHTLTWTHGGQLAFEVRLLRADGTRVAAPVTTTGAGQGSATFELGAAGAYLFDVDADGPWSITLAP